MKMKKNKTRIIIIGLIVVWIIAILFNWILFDDPPNWTNIFIVLLPVVLGYSEIKEKSKAEENK